MIQISFLIGLQIDETSMMCGFVSAFLHNFFLSAVGWMFFEGFQLYIMLTTDDMLLEVENCSRMLSYYLLTYCSSILIVLTAVAIDPRIYTHSDYCIWIDQNVLFWVTFVGPIVIYILVKNDI